MLPSLRERVLERLGFSSAPPINLEGLRALYRAWCRHTTFDNLRKMTALRAAPPDAVVHCEECGTVLVRTPQSGL